MTALEIDSVSLPRPLEMGRTLEIGLKMGLRNETLGFNGRITSEKNFTTGSVNGPPDHGLGQWFSNLLHRTSESHGGGFKTIHT